VGNLVVGGTGKTPVVLALARTVREGGGRVAILTRGYGGEGSGVLRAGGWSGVSGEGNAGDEALLLSRRLPEVPVVVGKNRKEGALRFLQEEGVDLFLLDDGFQHRQLARDHDIVLLDARCPFGNGRRLPAGPLREGPRALARADVILVTGGDPGAPVPEALCRMSASHAPRAQILGVWTVPAGLHRLEEKESAPAESCRGVPVLAVSGIARPGRFHELLRSVGCVVREIAEFPDHHRFRAEEITELEARARRAGARLVTTAKDAIRLEGSQRREPWWVLEMELGIQGGWGSLVEALGGAHPAGGGPG
jgi:tetraacyldisaccharide 4'-kinase